MKKNNLTVLPSGICSSRLFPQKSSPTRIESKTDTAGGIASQPLITGSQISAFLKEYPHFSGYKKWLGKNTRSAKGCSHLLKLMASFQAIDNQWEDIVYSDGFTFPNFRMFGIFLTQQLTETLKDTAIDAQVVFQSILDYIRCMTSVMAKANRFEDYKKVKKESLCFGGILSTLITVMHPSSPPTSDAKVSPPVITLWSLLRLFSEARNAGLLAANECVVILNGMSTLAKTKQLCGEGNINFLVNLLPQQLSTLSSEDIISCLTSLAVLFVNEHLTAPIEITVINTVLKELSRRSDLLSAYRVESLVESLRILTERWVIQNVDALTCEHLITLLSNFTKTAAKLKQTQAKTIVSILDNTAVIIDCLSFPPLDKIFPLACDMLAALYGNIQTHFHVTRLHGDFSWYIGKALLTMGEMAKNRPALYSLIKRGRLLVSVNQLLQQLSILIDSQPLTPQTTRAIVYALRGSALLGMSESTEERQALADQIIPYLEKNADQFEPTEYVILVSQLALYQQVADCSKDRQLSRLLQGVLTEAKPALPTKGSLHDQVAEQLRIESNCKKIVVEQEFGAYAVDVYAEFKRPSPALEEKVETIRVVVELDGSFHNEENDLYKDAVLRHSKVVDLIVRINLMQGPYTAEQVVHIVQQRVAAFTARAGADTDRPLYEFISEVMQPKPPVAEAKSKKTPDVSSHSTLPVPTEQKRNQSPTTHAVSVTKVEAKSITSDSVPSAVSLPTVATPKIEQVEPEPTIPKDEKIDSVKPADIAQEATITASLKPPAVALLSEALPSSTKPEIKAKLVAQHRAKKPRSGASKKRQKKAAMKRIVAEPAIPVPVKQNNISSDVNLDQSTLSIKEKKDEKPDIGTLLKDTMDEKQQPLIKSTASTSMLDQFNPHISVLYLKRDDLNSAPFLRRARTGSAFEQYLLGCITNDPSWYQLAAEQGHPLAQDSLGVAYCNGVGVAKDPEKGVMWLRKAAEQGQDNAQFNLARCCAEGTGIPRDEKAAADWYHKAAEQGHPPAQNSLGIAYCNGVGVAKDPEKGVMWLRKAAEQGQDHAQFNLARCYAEGTGIPRDEKAAVDWFHMAAEQGYLRAQNSLGKAYCTGTGVAEDPKTAEVWFKKAAEQGECSAQFNLAELYAKEKSSLRDEKAAFHWYHMAAEQGLAAGQYKLSECYRNGIGTAKDSTQAFKWFMRSAQHGWAEAEYNLGMFYLEGNKAHQNDSTALQWLRKAADQGHAESQNQMGLLYDQGRGVIADSKQAVEWYIKSAQQGNKVAQHNLGVCYFDGTGVAKDPKAAVGWFQKSAEQGHLDAQSNLAMCYLQGVGVTEDLSKGFTLLKQAAKHGKPQIQFNLGLCYEQGWGTKKNPQKAKKWFMKSKISPPPATPALSSEAAEIKEVKQQTVQSPSPHHPGMFPPVAELPPSPPTAPTTVTDQLKFGQ